MDPDHIIWCLALLDEQNEIAGRVSCATRGVAVFSPMLFSEVLG